MKIANFKAGLKSGWSKWLVLCLLLVALAAPASADTRLIVRVNGGLPVLQTVCRLLNCTVQYSLGDDLGQVFLVTTPNLLTLRLAVTIPGILSIELDQTGKTIDPPSQGGAPPALYDSRPVNYYGTTVRGFVSSGGLDHRHRQQRLQRARLRIVIIIDTGVDPHPVLQKVLVPVTISRATSRGWPG